MLKRSTGVHLIIVFVFIITGCSPIPLIQSPRIDSKVAISASIINSGTSGINLAEEGIKSKSTFAVDERIPFSMSFGIRNRVELSGLVFPYFLYGFLWRGNVKVALFAIGEDDFKNLATAIFMGSTGYFGEHEDVTNAYGGVSFGTLAHLGPVEFEFVQQTSISKEYYESSEDSGQHTIFWLQPAFGIVCKPGRNRRVQLNLGVNYSQPIKSDIRWHHYSQELSTSRVLHSTSSAGGFTFLGEVRFTIVR